MANGVNKVILVGHLGKDPEILNLENGVKKANFSLATTESYKDKSGTRTSVTEWHNVVLWRGLAEIAETYLKKGAQIYLEGKIRSRSYDDKEGVKRYAYDIVGDFMQMLGGPKPQGSEEHHASAENATTASVDNNFSPVEDDLPF
ncbi:MAG: single-stranded DNA-binding protein [Bacteroidota bacterium]